MNTSTLNADPQELAKFGDLAHRWWDPAGEFKPLHQINPLRLEWIAGRAGGLRDQQVLDVGCGGGILAESMARAGARVTGIDLSVKPLKVARLHAMEAGVTVDYREVAVEALATERPGSFDTVTCMEMLEHVPDPASVVRSCAALVKPGGRVFFSTLNRNPKSFLFAIVGAEHVLKMLPKGTHEYGKFIRPHELSAFAREAGLEVTEMTGLHYNPLTQRYWLAADTSVNYMVACRRPLAA